jgi:ribosomal protein S17
MEITTTQAHQYKTGDFITIQEGNHIMTKIETFVVVSVKGNVVTYEEYVPNSWWTNMFIKIKQLLKQ